MHTHILCSALSTLKETVKIQQNELGKKRGKELSAERRRSSSHSCGG